MESLEATSRSAGQHQLELEQAVADFQRALAAAPDSAELACNLGAALARVKRWPEACESYRLALRLRPDFAEAQCNLANALKELGRFDEARATYEAAIVLRPNFAEAYFNLGNMFYAQRQHQLAIDAFRQALAIRADYAKAANNLGNVWRDWDRLDEAVAAYELALRIRPRYVAALANLAQVLEKSGRHDEAVLATMRCKVAENPQSPEFVTDLGTALAHRGEFQAAMECYGAALELDPRNAEAHSNRAVLRLLLGNLGQGFVEFEWRFKRKNNPPRPFGQPRWEGSALQGRTILLHSEQGMGDVMQFVRYAASVKSRGGTVVVECYRPLGRLLAHAPGIDRVVVRGDPLPDFDVHAPLASLPYILGTTEKTIPGNIPYLVVDEQLEARWREIIGHSDLLKIGLAWQGNPKHSLDHMRSVPLGAFRALARLSAIRLYSLQAGAGAEQLNAHRDLDIVDLGSRFDDYSDTAAAIKNLDLVISVDTSVLHLAGGLGVPVWGLIARLPDWRWQLDRTDSPWYPTLRLFRQAVDGDWEHVLERVCCALNDPDDRLSLAARPAEKQAFQD